MIHVTHPHAHAGTYRSWTDYRATFHGLPARPVTTATPAPPPAVDWAAEWRDCPYCWGQGRILTAVRRPNGRLIGHTQDPCPRCLGVGADTP